MYKVYLTKEFTFDAAHHLPNYEGKCNNLHGHTYTLEVTVSGGIDLEDIGKEDVTSNDLMVMDFVDLDNIVKKTILSHHDHADLNTLYDYPTAEVMVIYIYTIIKANLLLSVKLESVKLWESSKNFAEYRGEIV